MFQDITNRLNLYEDRIDALQEAVIPVQNIANKLNVYERYISTLQENVGMIINEHNILVKQHNSLADHHNTLITRLNGCLIALVVGLLVYGGITWFRRSKKGWLYD